MFKPPGGLTFVIPVRLFIPTVGGFPPKVIVVRLLQPEKGVPPMLVTKGELTLSRLVQYQKAEPPMLVTKGKLTLIRLTQFWKAPWSMLVAKGI